MRNRKETAIVNKKIEAPVVMDFFGRDFRMKAPKGRNVTYNYLQVHLSQRYRLVKDLLGVDSLTSDVMSAMVKKMFEDHDLQWDDGPSSPTRQHGWYRSLLVGFGSRGGVRNNKLKKEGHVPKQSFKNMKHKLASASKKTAVGDPEPKVLTLNP